MSFYQVRATETEKYLTGKKLSDSSFVQEAAKILTREITPNNDPHQGTPEYRKSLARDLLYKVGECHSYVETISFKSKYSYIFKK